MPCNTQRRIEIDIGKMDPGLVDQAIQEAGLAGLVTYREGVLTMRASSNREKIISQVKESYAAQVVKSQAKKFGWAIKETGRFQYEVTKR